MSDPKSSSNGIASAIVLLVVVVGAIAVFYFGVYDTAQGRCSRGDFAACAVVPIKLYIPPAAVSTPAPTPTPSPTPAPTIDAYGPTPAANCPGSWASGPDGTDWRCYSAAGDEIAGVPRVPNLTFQTVLEEAATVTTQEDCTARFPELFWYADGGTGPTGSCRSHQ